MFPHFSKKEIKLLNAAIERDLSLLFDCDIVVPLDDGRFIGFSMCNALPICGGNIVELVYIGFIEQCDAFGAFKS